MFDKTSYPQKYYQSRILGKTSRYSRILLAYSIIYRFIICMFTVMIKCINYISFKYTVSYGKQTQGYEIWKNIDIGIIIKNH